MARRLATIGVYGFDLGSFLAAVHEGGVTLLLDIRQRRGVRGPEYAWANSQRLQKALAGAGIGYEHLPELAPTTELRQLQYDEDDRQGVAKRDRDVLSEAFAAAYSAEILEAADLEAVTALLPGEGAAALLCVERDPDACHRSLVAARLAGLEPGLTIAHLTP